MCLIDHVNFTPLKHLWQNLRMVIYHCPVEKAILSCLCCLRWLTFQSASLFSFFDYVRFLYFYNSFIFSLVYQFQYLVNYLANNFCSCTLFEVLNFSCIIFNSNILFSSYNLIVWFDLLPAFFFFILLPSFSHFLYYNYY